MKTLVFKEFRENVKVAALGLVIYTLVLVLLYRAYVASPTNMTQPLADSSLVFGTAWFCGIFGAVLGWQRDFPRESHGRAGPLRFGGGLAIAGLHRLGAAAQAFCGAV